MKTTIYRVELVFANLAELDKDYIKRHLERTKFILPTVTGMVSVEVEMNDDNPLLVGGEAVKDYAQKLFSDEMDEARFAYSEATNRDLGVDF